MSQDVLLVFFLFLHSNWRKKKIRAERWKLSLLCLSLRSICLSTGSFGCCQSGRHGIEKRFQSASVDREPNAESAKWMFVSRKPKMGGMMVISAAMSVKTPLPPCHASITPHCIVTPPPPPLVLISHICPSSLSQAVYGDAHSCNGWPLEWKQPQ